MESLDCASSAPLEISSKSLQQIVGDFNKLSELFQDQERIKTFLIRFPFEQLLKFSIADLVTLKYCIGLIEFISKYEEFYLNENCIYHCVDFILITLSSLQQNGKEVIEILDLLIAIIIKLADYKLFVDSNRLVEILLKLTTIDSFDSLIAERCYNILNYIIVISDIVPERINELIPQIFGKFKEINAIGPICLVCKHLLQHKEYRILNFEPILRWLTDDSLQILRENTHDQLTNIQIIECLAIFEREYELVNIIENNDNECEKIDNFLPNLIKTSSNLCVLSIEPTVRYYCCKLLELILKYFFKQQNLPIKTIEIFDTLNGLPYNIDEWPKSDNLWFFPICHAIKLHSQFLWKNIDVINSISRCFYEKRNLLSIHVLKAIYFLYSVLNQGLNDTNTTILGLDLLQYFENYSEISQIYSYNQEQLQWFLSKGTKLLKLTILRKWLISNFDQRSLIRTIKKCRAQDVLLQILYDNFDEPPGIAAANLMAKMKDSQLSNRITLTLPLAINKPKIMNVLLLSGPGIALDSKYLLLICTLMGAIIGSLNDQQVLKGACLFTVKLLLHLRHQPESVKEFCRNLTNIRYLIGMCSRVDDDVAVQIIKLIQTLIAIQKQNELKFDECLYEDFERFFTKSPSVYKTIRVIKFIYSTIIYKYSLIRMKESCIFTVYQRLLDLTFNPKLTKISYSCLSLFLQREHWLALSLYTNLHIDNRCMRHANFENVEYFIQFLYWWLLILQKESPDSYLPISIQSIRSFVSRTPQSTISKVKNIYLLLNLLTEKHSSLV